jgi:signal recognition particle receptor subunit beta
MLLRPDDIIIAVMGITGSGKTTFISHFADKDVEIGHGLESCMAIPRATAEPTY